MKSTQSKPSQHIRWGIIGCGDVTEVKSGPAYQKVNGFSLCAVMRRNAALAEDYAVRHGIDVFYSNADDLINDDTIDAVYIATPPDSHKEYGLKVAAAGKICCIEKPLAPSLSDSKAILSAFTHANVPLFVAYYRRTLPRFEKIQTLLAQGDIGDVRHVTWLLNKSTSHEDSAKTYNWRTDAQVAPGGYFDDLASHGLDLIAYLLGNYKTVKGLGVNQQGLYSALDSISACWQHDNNITGSASWNFGSFEDSDLVTIFGSEGKITFSVFDDMPVEITTKNGKKTFAIAHPDNVQLHHVQAMADHLFNNTQHPSTGENAVHTSWVMDKILQTAPD